MNKPKKHNLIKDKGVNLIERIFHREGSLYITYNDRNAFFTYDAVRNYNLWSCQKVCDALTFLLDNIYIRLGSKLYRQIVGIPIPSCRGWLGGAMVLGKLPVPGRPTIWITVGQGPTALANIKGKDGQYILRSNKITGDMQS